MAKTPKKQTADETKSAEAQPKITIDGVTYDASDLSNNAKGALGSLRFTEAKLQALQNELAVCQTARFAYVKALKEELGEATEK